MGRFISSLPIFVSIFDQKFHHHIQAFLAEIFHEDMDGMEVHNDVLPAHSPSLYVPCTTLRSSPRIRPVNCIYCATGITTNR